MITGDVRKPDASHLDKAPNKSLTSFAQHGIALCIGNESLRWQEDLLSRLGDPAGEGGKRRRKRVGEIKSWPNEVRMSQADYSQGPFRSDPTDSATI
jgi:hypothetical protein